MLDNQAVEVLAAQIKQAFVSALPANLPMNVRNGIEASYTPLTNAIAAAISTFVKKASVKVEMTRDNYRRALEKFTDKQVGLNCFYSQSGTPANIRAILDASNIQYMVKDNQTQTETIEGTLE